MTKLRALILWFLAASPSAFGVYAPVPEQEQGKALTFYLGSSISHDSNIFGASDGGISSMVYQLDPGLTFNASVGPRTFASAAYRLSLTHVPDRPGDKTLDSHEASARVAHTFTPLTEIDLSNTFQVVRNPQSLLPGVARVVNTDQSYRRNQADLRFASGLNQRTGLAFKFRSTHFAYEEASLGRSLDREEYLGGLAATHLLLPGLQMLAEYRHQEIRYVTAPETKDKRSDFALVGVDRDFGTRGAVSARLGVENRRRRSEDRESSPYVELGLKYDHAADSYVAAGYSYSIEETSNIELYTDIAVSRWFVNVQQKLLAKVSATGSVTWEPSKLRARKGRGGDRDETNLQLGLALIYRPARNWTAALTFDRDNITSDDPSRQLKRTRTGANLKYVF